MASNPQVVADFRDEMTRFLPVRLVASTVNEPAFWSVMVRHIQELDAQVQRQLSAQQALTFPM